MRALTGWWLSALIFGPASAGLGGAEPPTPGLWVSEEGELMHGDEPYSGIGVNYFSCFYRAVKDPADTSYEQGFAALEERGIPFARFMCGAFWPSEMALYFEDRERYYELLDAMVESAKRHGIGLIPSFFWAHFCVPDLVGEPVEEWGNPESKTHEFMRTYVREIVTRYRESPVIWAWEFGNEYNLMADLPNAAEHRPPTHITLGNPAERSARDELSHDQIRTAIQAFAEEVRRYDPHRAIISGNAFPRPSAWHQREEGTWTQDTPEQFAEMLLGDNPGPVDTLCVHAYGDAERLQGAMEVARASGKPLFVGEFGVPGPETEESREQFAELLGLIRELQVPLAALWVYDHSHQDGEWNVTPGNKRAYQLETISAER